jgi:phosphate transport system protein
MSRLAFHQELDRLQQNVVTMASMVEKQVLRSVDALKRNDVQLARDIYHLDKPINEIRWKTEEDAILLIATQAPVARDLRRIVAVIAMVTELERMGDHAAGMSKIVIELAEEPPLKELVDIPRMADIALEMLRETVTAFIESDIVAARKIAERDDEVDQLYDQVYRELLTYMLGDPRTINRATKLLWAAHNIERFADRVTNICERVIYSVTGANVSLPDEA